MYLVYQSIRVGAYTYLTHGSLGTLGSLAYIRCQRRLYVSMSHTSALHVPMYPSYAYGRVCARMRVWARMGAYGRVWRV